MITNYLTRKDEPEKSPVVIKAGFPWTKEEWEAAAKAVEELRRKRNEPDQNTK